LHDIVDAAGFGRGDIIDGLGDDETPLGRDVVGRRDGVARLFQTCAWFGARRRAGGLMPPSSASTPRRFDLTGILRHRQASILRGWREAVRELPRAAELPIYPLLDFIPELLVDLADAVERAGAHEPRPSVDSVEPPKKSAERHTMDRLHEDFDLKEIVVELTLLRQSILAVWAREGVDAEDPVMQRVLSQALDRMIVAAVSRYTDVCERVLRSLDRISSLAVEVDSLDEFLWRAVEAIGEQVPAVDAATIFLRRDGELTLRAQWGLGGGEGFTLSLGEGHVGAAAADRRVVQLDSARVDPIAELHGARDLKALYAIPLCDDDQVVGVADMGSRGADSFGVQERILFAAIAERVTAGIRQHTLREREARRSQELEASEHRFRVTFSAAPVGIALVALDGRIQRVNRAYAKIFGRTPQEATALRFEEAIHADDRGAGVEAMRRVVNGQIASTTLELRHVRRGGEIVWVDLSISLVRDALGHPDYVVLAANDITTQRELRERLAFLTRASDLIGSSLNLRETIQQLAEVAVPTIADGCVVKLAGVDRTLGEFDAIAHRDPAKTRLMKGLGLEYPAIEDAPGLVGEVVRTGQPRVLHEVDDDVLRMLALNEAHHAVLERLELRSLLFLPLLEQGRVSGVMSLAQAESGRTFGAEDVELAQELARRASSSIELAHLHEQTERAVRLRDQVLAIVSHDLRNPIGTISLAAGLLLRDPAAMSSPRARKQADTIARNTARASRLIADLLDVSSIQTGQLSLRRERCAIAGLLAEAIDAHTASAERAQIALRADIQVDDREIVCDHDRVLQVLGNLLGNALKFCDAGATVILRARLRADEAVITVEDDGPGIPDEEQDRIFSLYWRKPSGERGTGLGLFIARGLVQAHGGRLWVDSRVGEGSAFHVALPLPHPKAS
jgi:PAS domain S-box-containing protein